MLRQLCLFYLLMSGFLYCSLLYAENHDLVELNVRSSVKKPFSLVELFTNENCQVCPKVSSLAYRQERGARNSGERIFLLDFHVDYLKNPLWKDNYARTTFSERQQEYVKSLKLSRSVPGQAIINGQYAAQGDNDKELSRKIYRALQIPAKASIEVDTKVVVGSSAVNLRFKVDGLQRIRREFFYFHAAIAESEVERFITDGPNSGKKYNHTNLVRVFETSRFDGKEGTGSLDLVYTEDLRKEHSSIICFVQDPTTKVILAAERIKLP